MIRPWKYRRRLRTARSHQSAPNTVVTVPTVSRGRDGRKGQRQTIQLVIKTPETPHHLNRKAPDKRRKNDKRRHRSRHRKANEDAAASSELLNAPSSSSDTWDSDSELDQANDIRGSARPITADLLDTLRLARRWCLAVVGLDLLAVCAWTTVGAYGLVWTSRCPSGAFQGYW